MFVNAKGVERTVSRLPKNSRLLYKVPKLARSSPKGLSKAEQDLQRYMQLILPSARSTKDLLKTVQSWPWVQQAHLTPEISLPMEKSVPEN